MYLHHKKSRQHANRAKIKLVYLLTHSLLVGDEWTAGPDAVCLFCNHGFKFIRQFFVAVSRQMFSTIQSCP
jgi:hypothetical protein